MSSLTISTVIVPGVMSLLLALVFTYLYEQSRQQYFRAWQLAWIAYALYFGVLWWVAFRGPALWASLAASLMLVATALFIFISTRLMRGKFRWRWYDLLLAFTGVILALWKIRDQILARWLHHRLLPGVDFQLAVVLAVVLLYCSFYFYRQAQLRNSLFFTLLSLSLALWGVLLWVGQLRSPYAEIAGAVTQMLLGISMVMVLFDNERNAVQENALAFSTLGVDPTRLLSAEDLRPSLQSILDRLKRPMPGEQAVICIREQWRTVLPSVQRGFSPEFLTRFEASGAGEYICELAYRRGGFVSLRNLPEIPEPLPAFPGSGFQQFRQTLAEEKISSVTAVSLQTRENNFGVILFPYAERRVLGSSNPRLLTGLALQIGLTLENYVVMHNAQRRTKEYELLTQIGQAISSRLDQDEVLRAVQKELGQIFDTSNFYVAFLDGESLHYDLEVESGEIQPKTSRTVDNGLTEYILRTGQPLLIRSELEKARERLGVTAPVGRSAKCYCGAPILLAGKPAGVMAALSHEREFVFEPRDLEVMQTAAGQVSVAVENARLFAGEQLRARQLSFLNSISKTAISSEDFEQMLAEIVAEIQKNFNFDHIGIGIFDYATKDIEIKAEAGATTKALGKRIPLGAGILGRVARTGESALVQMGGEGHVQGVLPESRAVLCIPIMYGETLLGVLNVESKQEDAFTPQDVMIMNTLADLLATALHNAFHFQKMQQHSITDALTGIKTRRFFWEAISSEWKRASRSGRPFSVILMDLDKFKQVNDSRGHLEGDLVLARVGRLLEQKCRQSNVVARYGGDEFIILMPETGMEQARALAERLRLWIAADSMLSEHRVTGSFGVASFPGHGFTAEDIIRVADAGMYVSKHGGGDQVSIAEEFSEGESAAVQHQLISGYVEGFLQREHTGPEHLEELLTTLKKLWGGEGECDPKIMRESIEIMTRSAESREMNNAGHGDLTAHYSEMMARALNLPAAEVADLVYAARVHDVGKIFVPERILNKTGPLSDEEFYLVKLHSRVGAEIVGTLPDSKLMQEAIEHHHEAFDGSGYPAGQIGEHIPLWSRILGIADAYVNMTTERSFSSAKTSEQALAELEKLSGARYDGMLVRVLMHEMKADRVSKSS